MDKMLDAVEWIPCDSTEPTEFDKDLPRQTHSGVLTLAGVPINVIQLSNGMRIFPEGEIEKLFAALQEIGNDPLPSPPKEQG